MDVLNEVKSNIHVSYGYTCLFDTYFYSNIYLFKYIW